MNYTPITLKRTHEQTVAHHVTLVRWIAMADGWYGYTKENIQAKPYSVMAEPSFYSQAAWSVLEEAK